MAQEPAAPWSRWDAPGYQFISSNTAPPSRQYDFGQVQVAAPYQGAVASAGTGVQYQPSMQQTFVVKTLVDVRPDADNPDFLDCVYALPNVATRIVEQCMVDIGCCSTTCCKNTSWQTKYRWAVALISIFSALVLIALAVWLISYLINRQKDKKQKKLLAGSSGGISPAPSQVSMTDPYGGRVDSGYYPYVGGPKRTY